MAEQPRTDREALAYLLRLAGYRPLGKVAGLMAVSSATEGIGLLLLVPIVHLVAGGAGLARAPDWLAAFAGLPLWLLLAGFVALIALRAAIMLAVTTERQALSLSLVRRLRGQAQGAILAADWRWLAGQRSADHGALIVGEADRVGRLVDRALDTVTTLITLTALLAAALWLSWQLTLLTVSLGAATAVVLLVARRRRESHGAQFSDAYHRLQRHVANGLAHLRAARIAGAQDTLAADFAGVASDLEAAETQYNQAVNRARFVIQVVAAAMLAVIVWVGLMVMALPLVLFVPVLAIFARVVPLIDNLQNGWRSWRYCRPALDELLRTVDAARAAAEPIIEEPGTIAFEREIALAGVTMRFPGRHGAVLDGLTRTIAAGAVVAVTGPSGSGKSTLADILAGLVAPDGGTVSVDGVPLTGERRIRWRRQVAYVEQVPYLLDGMIAENLAWGHSGIGRPALEQALRDASADFVLALPDGLDTVVGESGRELSGGERQRISLARALLRRPSLVILDEVTAALDARNEASIGRTIERLRGTCTFVILGHRPALRALADAVIELGGDGRTERPPR